MNTETPMADIDSQKLRNRVIQLFIVITLVLASISGISIYRVTIIDNTVDKLTKVAVPLYEHSNELIKRWLYTI